MQMRASILARLSIAAAFACAVAQAVNAQAAQRHEVNIEPQPIGAALKALADQTGLQVLMFSDDAGDKRSPAVRGRFTNEEALGEILRDSGLTYQKIDDNTVAIRTRNGKVPASALQQPQAEARSIRLAQYEAGASASPSHDMWPASVARLEEIVVTATKRPSSVRDVPISMSVFTGEALTDRSINNLEEMSGYQPNLKIADTSVTTNIYMRGIGSGLDRGFEQSVGLFVDGIYMGRSKQYRAPMLDVDRVEVLRGPQPVMFGKNTTAGAIKIETRKPQPGADLSAELAAEYEFEHEGKQITGVLSGSPTDTFALRFAGMYEETDGFAANSYRNVDEPAVEQWVARLTSVWAPVEGEYRGQVRACRFRVSRLARRGFEDCEPAFRQPVARSGGCPAAVRCDRSVRARSRHRFARELPQILG